MKYIYYLVFISGILHPTDCENFTNGEFEMDIGNGTVYRITRTGDKQIEEDSKRGIKVEYDIKWDSECKYKLYNFNPIQGKDLLPSRPYDTLYCQIVDIEDNSFRVIAKADKLPERKSPVIKKVR
jgi:hypothetical protein